MGCCQSKKENTIDNPDKKDGNPEGASLRHPQADANKNPKDEEIGKKVPASPVPPQQGQGEVKKGENPLPAPAQATKKEAYEDATKAGPKPETSAPKTGQDPKQQAAPAHPANPVAAKNPETKPLIQKPQDIHADGHAGHQQGAAATNKLAAVSNPVAEAPKPAPKQESPKKSDRPFSLKEILEVFNDVRVNPGKYADRVQILYLDHINDKNVNMRTKVMTNEGKGPYIEAKKFLASQAPLKRVELDDGLTAAAYLHSVYAAELDELTHEGKGKSTAMSRIKEFGVMAAGMCAENILNRRDVTPEEWILDFIIDDGVVNRGHRKNIFNEQVSKVGLGVARKNHQSEWFFTMDFTSDGYKSDKSKIPAKVLEDSGLADYHRETSK